MTILASMRRLYDEHNHVILTVCAGNICLRPGFVDGFLFKATPHQAAPCLVTSVDYPFYPRKAFLAVTFDDTIIALLMSMACLIDPV